MTKTIHVCDACGKEVEEDALIPCFEDIKDYASLKLMSVQEGIELCEECYKAAQKQYTDFIKSIRSGHTLR